MSHGTTNVRLSELFTDEFLSKYIKFSSIKEMDETSGYRIETQKDFDAIPIAAWNNFIRSSSCFDSWQTMLNAAIKNWTKNQHVLKAISTRPTAEIHKKQRTNKHYNPVVTNEVGLLKTGDQWFEETTQKRRLRSGSAKAYDWLLPFMPLEAAKYYKLIPVLEWGPNSACVIAKELRAVIRERKKLKQPYEDLLRSLYGCCILIDFAKSLTFDGFYISSMTRHVNIRELRSIHIDYSTMGYHYIEALSKTDIKWLVEVFGEPVKHQLFDVLWPNIRVNAISRYCWEKLQKASKTARSLGLAQNNMEDWLRTTLARELESRKEWLSQKTASEAQQTTQPVTVQTADYIEQRGYAIPAPPKPSHSFSLDMSSIEVKLAETVAVSAILKDIFTEAVTGPSQTAVLETTTTDVSIAGLDAQSFSFMQVLASKHFWARDELEKLAAEHSLMLDGTLDSINDASFDLFDGPFFEGDDPIEIDPDIVNRLGARDADL